MKDICIKSLSGVSFDTICESFLSAFADYGMDLDKNKLRDMLVRRGARFDLSFAAFDGEKIVSFIINGIGEYDGNTTAYDTGTGTIKEYRGLGLTDKIFSCSIEYLKEAEIKHYLLEVLKNNAPALKIYTRQGFEVTRQYDCYTSDNAGILDKIRDIENKEVEIKEISAANLKEMEKFMDFKPSWQNSIDSIMRNPEAFKCIAAFEKGVSVGFGVSESAYGDISLLAVEKTCRRRGIGARLLDELLKANKLGVAKVLNIEDSCISMTSFLNRVGFAASCEQYEMIKKL